MKRNWKFKFHEDMQEKENDAEAESPLKRKAQKAGGENKVKQLQKDDPTVKLAFARAVLQTSPRGDVTDEAFPTGIMEEDRICHPYASINASVRCWHRIWEVMQYYLKGTRYDEVILSQPHVPMVSILTLLPSIVLSPTDIYLRGLAEGHDGQADVRV